VQANGGNMLKVKWLSQCITKKPSFEKRNSYFRSKTASQFPLSSSFLHASGTFRPM